MKRPFTLILIVTMPFVYIHTKAQDEKVKTNVDTLNAPPVIYKINTGYTEQFENEIVFSVPILKDDEDLVPSDNVLSRLQGIVPGLNVIGNGAPGNVPDVYIRGFGSFHGNTPLFIVDGIPVSDLSMLNPADVQTIAFLKDGAASIYGARAMDGVIVITTKRGIKGLKVGYNVIYGLSLPGKGTDDELLNAEEYGQLQWLVYRNDNYEEYHPVYGPSTNPEATLPDWAGNTDWYGEMTRNAPVQRHELSVRGGSDHSRIFASFGAHSEDGLLIHTYLRRYHLRFNSEWDIFNDRVTVGENFTISLNKFNDMPLQGEDNPFLMGPYRSQSIIPVYMDRSVDGTSHDFRPGDFGGTGLAPKLGNSGNVVAELIRNKDDYNWNMSALGNFWVTFQLFKGLSFTSNFGGTYTANYWIDFADNTYERAQNTTAELFTEGSGYLRDQVWTNMLRYDQTFGVHHIQLVAAKESIKPGKGRKMLTTGMGYFSDAYSYRTVSNSNSIAKASSWILESEPLKSLLFNANYALMNRYLLTLNIRRDKGFNYYFSPDEEQRNYTSFAAAWKIGHERFLSNMGWINGLTLRGSFGKTGNKSMNWEYSEILDFGFEWRFFNRQLNIDFDWYKKESSDLLFALPQPGTMNPIIHYVNTGSISNTGIDFRIGYTKKWNLIGLDANLIVSSYRNRINNLTEGIDFYDSQETRIGTAARNSPGHPLGEFYGYKVAGLFQENEFHMELDEDYYAILVLNDGIPSQYGAGPGLLKFENADASDGEITPDDRIFIGNPHPDFTMGFNPGLTVGNFDLNALLYWSQGNEIFNYTKWWTDFWPSFQGQKSKRLLYESWTSENTIAKIPKASNTSNFSTNAEITSYYIEDGSYIRMKSLQLGYSINKSILKKAHISSLRVYLQALNLFTITEYSGMDPELGGSFGIDNGNYPNTRQFLVGLQLEI